TSGSFSSPSMRIASVFGTRTGAVTINQFDDDTLARGVRRSEEVARLAPEDREFMPALDPQAYAVVPHGFDRATAEVGAEAIAKGVSVCLKDAIAAGLTAAGFAETRAGYSALANSKGLFGYHTSTNAYIGETVRTPDGTGSGWAAQAAPSARALHFPAVAQSASTKARTSREPRPLAPGSYPTILEPACVASLLELLMWSMSRRDADEGRSYFSAPNGGNRLGEKLFGDGIQVYSDPADPRVPGTPWGEDGLPQQRVDWIEGGVVKALRCDRYWATQKNVAPIPGGANLIMGGGSGSVLDLIAATKRGVLVTSLWYVRSLDPQTLTFTGLTRDGVFWIEDGKVRHPVRNFRWNESPVSMLKNVVGMSEAVAMPPRPSRDATTVVPALALSSFNFSSVSEAV
ncbi:MAG TPA: metallopeptidase TldD-related protein, partial [Kofleriaceae bacterium]|nr:metallopeptidase TldD-related protein [Kofleriaceae bacterium]